MSDPNLHIFKQRCGKLDTTDIKNSISHNVVKK